MGELQVSVVLATHDRPERLARQLKALRAQDLDRAAYEIIVVDDASGPATGRLLERETEALPFVRPIRREASTGPAAARNTGWRIARAPLIAFTDDDCEAAPGWLSRLVQAARAHPGAIVQGQTLPHPDDQAAAGPFSHTLTNDRIGPWFETANILYPRELLERLGGFDEHAFSHPGGEDTDLAWKAIGAGARAVWEPGALVYHAVANVGWRALLRRAWHWDETMLCFKRHPDLRRELRAGLFWTDAHLRLVVALTAALPWLPRPLRALLLVPYVRRLYAGRHTPHLAPFRLALDVVELIACLRGAIRYRVVVL